MKKKISFERLAKIAIGIILFIFLYLFALNGRYAFYAGKIFDKWTQTTYRSDSEGKLWIRKR